MNSAMFRFGKVPDYVLELIIQLIQKTTKQLTSFLLIFSEKNK